LDLRRAVGPKLAALEAAAARAVHQVVPAPAHLEARAQVRRLVQPPRVRRAREQPGQQVQRVLPVSGSAQVAEVQRVRLAFRVLQTVSAHRTALVRIMASTRATTQLTLVLPLEVRSETPGLRVAQTRTPAVFAQI